MANSQTNSNQIDRLSKLPVELLITILSFLPTHIAARTSVLCRCFRHLWEASPSLALNSYSFKFPHRSRIIDGNFSKNFIAMAQHVLNLNFSHPILSLHIDVIHINQNVKFMVSTLLAMDNFRNLRHLTLRGFTLLQILPILPRIFTINPLRCLKLDSYDYYGDIEEYYYGLIQELNFPSEINLTCLRSLSLKLLSLKLPHTDLTGLNPFISKLSSLEDFHLDISGMPRLSLYSQTVRKLELIVTEDTYVRKLDIVHLSLPSLESLKLKIEDRFGQLSHIHANSPLLRKAEIYLLGVHERNVSLVAGLLNCIAHVEELKLELKDNKNHDYPKPILLESGQDVPIFSNLKHLNVTLWFHKQNFEAVTRMLHNCPVLKSLNLHHYEIPCFLFERRLKRRDWQSKLPRNTDGHHNNACFRNLHLEEEQKKFRELLSKKYSFKN